MRFKSKIYFKFLFTQSFFRFLLVDRIMIKKDNLVLVTGKRGDGKTTLALKIIMGFNNMEKVEEDYNHYANLKKEEGEKEKYKLEGFKPFDLENDMAFTRKHLQDLCKNNYNAFILGDEAIVNVARRNAMTKANKILHEVLTINRKNGNTVFFCLPSIEDFDISMLQYVTHWIHIDDRGVGAVMFPEPKSIFGRKVWDIERMKKTYEKFKEDNPTVSSLPYWLFNNFRGYIKFRQLTSGVEKEYLRIANKKKNEDTEDTENKKKEEKTQKPKLSDEQKNTLDKITNELIKGEIFDTADYYKYCGETGFNKNKLNKEISELLAQKGDGRTALRIIKENKDKQKEEENIKTLQKRVIY